MRCIFLFFLLIFLNINFGEAASVATLKHVFVTYGIPHHTPVDYTSPQQEKARYTFTGKSEDKGNLTENGIDEAYKFGQYLAKTYGNALSISNWEENDYWAFGTSTNLTKQTAYIVGAGLRKDNQIVQDLKDKEVDERWAYEDLKSTPNPSVTQFEKFRNEKECPQYWKDLRNTVGTELVFQVIHPKMKTIDIINGKVGSIVNVNSRLLRFVYLALIMKQDNKEVTEWAKDDVMPDLRFIACKDLFLGQKTDKLKKLSGGRLADAIIKDIEELKKGKKVKDAPDGSDPKITIFAAPQDILASQVAAFNPTGTTFNGAVFKHDTFFPDIGAAHIIELYEDGDQWKVKILYRNKKEENGSFGIVKLPSCDNDNFCEISKLKGDLKTILLTTEQQPTECKKK